jgi:hypothetical protein
LLHFQISLKAGDNLQSIPVLLDTYARWGVRYAVLFDQPNLRTSWAAASWTQPSLSSSLSIFTCLWRVAGLIICISYNRAAIIG